MNRAARIIVAPANMPWLWLFVVLLLRGASVFGGATDSDAAFTEANRQYESGHYRQAAKSYQDLVAIRGASVPLLFNLGNAWLKDGQMGRARICYLLALELGPRDRDVRANLRFLRQTVGVDPTSWPLRWVSYLRWFGLNEWTAAATVLFWIWLGLLGAQRFRPKLQPVLKKCTRITSLVLGLCLLSLTLTAWERYGQPCAIVVVPTAEVRRGPLSESQVYYQLKDGTMIRSLDEQFGWREITDGSGRSGWLKSEQIVLLRPGPSALAELLRLPMPN
jgi:tetratricopeptide (TPR) repeat protein